MTPMSLKENEGPYLARVFHLGDPQKTSFEKKGFFSFFQRKGKTPEEALAAIVFVCQVGFMQTEAQNKLPKTFQDLVKKVYNCVRELLQRHREGKPRITEGDSRWAPLTTRMIRQAFPSLVEKASAFSLFYDTVIPSNLNKLGRSLYFENASIEGQKKEFLSELRKKEAEGAVLFIHLVDTFVLSVLRPPDVVSRGLDLSISEVSTSKEEEGIEDPYSFEESLSISKTGGDSVHSNSVSAVAYPDLQGRAQIIRALNTEITLRDSFYEWAKKYGFGSYFPEEFFSQFFLEKGCCFSSSLDPNREKSCSFSQFLLEKTKKTVGAFFGVEKLSSDIEAYLFDHIGIEEEEDFTKAVFKEQMRQSLLVYLPLPTSIKDTNSSKPHIISLDFPKLYSACKDSLFFLESFQIFAFLSVQYKISSKQADQRKTLFEILSRRPKTYTFSLIKGTSSLQEWEERQNHLLMQKEKPLEALLEENGLPSSRNISDVGRYRKYCDERNTQRLQNLLKKVETLSGEKQLPFLHLMFSLAEDPTAATELDKFLKDSSSQYKTLSQNEGLIAEKILEVPEYFFRNIYQFVKQVQNHLNRQSPSSSPSFSEEDFPLLMGFALRLPKNTKFFTVKNQEEYDRFCRAWRLLKEGVHKENSEQAFFILQFLTQSPQGLLYIRVFQALRGISPGQDLEEVFRNFCYGNSDLGETEDQARSSVEKFEAFVEEFCKIWRSRFPILRESQIREVVKKLFFDQVIEWRKISSMPEIDSLEPFVGALFRLFSTSQQDLYLPVLRKFFAGEISLVPIQLLQLAALRWDVADEPVFKRILTEISPSWTTCSVKIEEVTTQRQYEKIFSFIASIERFYQQPPFLEELAMEDKLRLFLALCGDSILNQGKATVAIQSDIAAIQEFVGPLPSSVVVSFLQFLPNISDLLKACLKEAQKVIREEALFVSKGARKNFSSALDAFITALEQTSIDALCRTGMLLRLIFTWRLFPTGLQLFTDILKIAHWESTRNSPVFESMHLDTHIGLEKSPLAFAQDKGLLKVSADWKVVEERGFPCLCVTYRKGEHRYTLDIPIEIPLASLGEDFFSLLSCLHFLLQDPEEGPKPSKKGKTSDQEKLFQEFPLAKLFLDLYERGLFYGYGNLVRKGDDLLEKISSEKENFEENSQERRSLSELSAKIGILSTSAQRYDRKKIEESLSFLGSFPRLGSSEFQQVLSEYILVIQNYLKRSSMEDNSFGQEKWSQCLQHLRSGNFAYSENSFSELSTMVRGLTQDYEVLPERKKEAEALLQFVLSFRKEVKQIFYSLMGHFESAALHDSELSLFKGDDCLIARYAAGGVPTLVPLSLQNVVDMELYSPFPILESDFTRFMEEKERRFKELAPGQEMKFSFSYLSFKGERATATLFCQKQVERENSFKQMKVFIKNPNTPFGNQNNVVEREGVFKETSFREDFSQLILSLFFDFQKKLNRG